MTEIITCPKCGAFVGTIQPAAGVDTEGEEPKLCPHCGWILFWNGTCKNMDCPGRKKRED